MANEITLARDGNVAELVISRPTARNAINFEMLQTLDSYLDQVHADPPRVLILRAEMPGFSAGIDLKESGEATSSFVNTRVRLMHRVLNKLRAVPIPVIGAINGVAAGLGCELAISADLRIVTPDARYGYPEPRVAVPSPTHHLVRLIGLARAQDMVFTARWISAEEAVQWGLATRIADDINHAVESLTADLLALSPLSLRRTKENLTLLINEGDAVASEHHINSVIEAAGSDDRKEALAAFAEKRAPNFTGT